jgi:hypothetical protein
VIALDEDHRARLRGERAQSLGGARHDQPVRLGPEQQESAAEVRQVE